MEILPVSIIIPTCNRADLLARALKSVIPQCIEDDEIIIVDDGSTDNTKDIIKANPRVDHYIQLSANNGVSVARNAGIEKSSRPLVAFLDDDDEWMPNKLQLQRTVFGLNPELVMSFTNFSSRWANGDTKKHCIFNWGHVETDWQKIIGSGVPYSELAALPVGEKDFNVHFGHMYYSQMTDDHVLPSTLMVRKELALPELYFNEGMRFLNSWECSGRLSKIGLAAYLDCDMTWQNDDNVKRITDASYLKRRIVQTQILENIWGNDEEFLAQHKVAYEQRVDKERLLMVREYLAQGRSRHARKEIKKLHTSPPVSYRALSWLPEYLFRLLADMRLKLK